MFEILVGLSVCGVLDIFDSSRTKSSVKCCFRQEDFPVWYNGAACALVVKV